MLETNPNHSGPGFPQEHLGGPVGEGEGASTAMGEGVDGAAEGQVEGMGETKGNGRCRSDGGNDRVMEGDGGVEMDGNGRGGSRQRVKLTEGKLKSKRKPLRGMRRRGRKNSIPEEEGERLALTMKRWLGGTLPGHKNSD